MIRVQRRAHARIFLVLLPLLTAAVLWALAQRQHNDRVLRTAAVARPIQTSEPEPLP